MHVLNVAIIGGGPAGLMAAEVLADAGVRATIYDRMPSLGRKFLMAGRGGLNLTHSEELETFLSRYRERAPDLEGALRAFPPQALRDWSEVLGEPTFVGSSGRVFPKSFKASPLLRAWLRRLGRQGVEVRLRHEWRGWSADGALRFATPAGEATAQPDATILALGGASWPRLGADGGWTSLLSAQGVSIAPLKPANCGFDVAWSEVLKARFAGEPLKSIALSFDGRTLRGEAIVTETGLEGGAIYALSAPLRDAILRDGSAILTVDLRPDTTHDALAHKLAAPRRKQSASSFLRKATGLSPVAIALLREAGPLLDSPAELAGRIKRLPVSLTGIRPLDHAISTAGGVAFNELDPNFMLRRLPGVFCCGEMLDWEAPTGGYLLQACFATGRAAGRGAIGFINPAF
jgi:uncharacterized flavoprotein (TIGR03862 family)